MSQRQRDEAKRKRRQRIPPRVLRPPKPPAGVRSTAIDQLKLNGERGADLGLRDAALDVEVELTMTGASTLTIPVHDPERVIGTVGILDRDRDGLLDDQIILEADGLEFSLVRIEREAPTYTLTFESLPVSLLRWYDEPRKAYRGRVTRAEFLWSLVREVRERKLRFYSPELRDRQPVEAVNLAPTETEVTRTSSGGTGGGGTGFGPGARVTVKGRSASPLQRNVIAGCLAEAERLGCSAKVMTAVVMCIIQESEAGALAGIQTGNDDVGIFQQGRNWIGVKGSKQPGPSTRAFLITGPSSWKKVHGSLRNVPGGYEAAIKAVQISVGGYQPWAAEAATAVAAFSGGASKGRISSGRLTTTKEVKRRYAFTRGQQGRRENTWACGTRLSEELAWRWFELAGTVIHASDEELIRQRPAMSVWDGADGIESIGWTVDRGRPADEATIECRAKAWGAVQGQVVELVDEGPATGKWLVESVSGSLLDEPRTVTLSRPQRKKPEPAPETRTLTSSRNLRGRSIGGAGGGASGGPLRQRIVDLAKQSMTVNSGFSRYSLTGTSNLTTILPRSGRTDCSQWIAAVYHKAGAGSPGTYTGDMIGKGRRTSNPKPADLLISSSHVEMYIGGGKTIGHGSPPIDYSTVDYWTAQGFYFITYSFLD